MKKFLFLLGAALLVASWAGASNFTDSKRIFVGRRDDTGTLVGGWYKGDSTGRYLKFDQFGNLLTTEANPTYMDGQVLTIIDAIGSLSGGGAAKAPIAEALDLRSYRSATLILTWDVRDSATVALGVHVYNKPVAAWATDDAVVQPTTLATNAPATTDSTAALTSLLLGTLEPPTFYVFRSTTAPVASTYSLTALAHTNRIVASAAGVAINLDNVCGKIGYLGLKLVNANATALRNVKAVVRVAR